MGKNTLVMDSRIYEDLLPSFFLCDTNLDVFRFRFIYFFLIFIFSIYFGITCWTVDGTTWVKVAAGTFRLLDDLW